MNTPKRFYKKNKYYTRDVEYDVYICIYEYKGTWGYTLYDYKGMKYNFHPLNVSMQQEMLHNKEEFMTEEEFNNILVIKELTK